MRVNRLMLWGALGLAAVAGSAVIMTAGFFAAYLVANIVVTRSVGPVVEQAEADTRHFLPEVLADTARLAGQPFFITPRPGGDASAYLNPRLLIDVGPDQTVQRFGVAEPTPPALSLTSEARTTIDRWGADWLAHADDPLVVGAELRWMAELRQFGFWQLDQNSRWADATTFDWVSLPFPQIGDMLRFAKLRILRGNREHRLAEAGEEVRHLAWLLYSTNTTLGAALAVSMLRLDATARTGKTDAGMPPPLDTPLLDAAKRALLSRGMMANPLLSPATFAETLPQDVSRPGDCALLTETGYTLLAFRSMLADSKPQQLAAFESALIRLGEPCRLQGLVAMWRGEGPRRAIDAVELSWQQDPQVGWLTRVPGTRRLVAMMTLAIAQPDPFAEYKKRAAVESP